MDFQRLLITGGAGFVGSNLALLFRERVPELAVSVLDNLKRRGSELNLPRLQAAGVAVPPRRRPLPRRLRRPAATSTC